MYKRACFLYGLWPVEGTGVFAFRKLGNAKNQNPPAIFDKHTNFKYKFGNRHFWAEGNYVSTVGLNVAIIKKYIWEQESHDIAMDKLSVKGYENSFMG